MLVAAFLLVFTHANVKLRLGVLTPLIVGPQVHRIHHSRLPEHQDKNFAQYFPVIDKMFGTYHAPGPDEFPPTGTPHLATDAPLSQVLSRPFLHWWKELN
jgi:sterol desaturase/sphingolipid hydroxylase (fatty acid hydroxylase superfamily)